VVVEYRMFVAAATTTTATTTSMSRIDEWGRPNPSLFEPTFLLLLQQSKGQKQSANSIMAQKVLSTNTTTTAATSNAAASSSASSTLDNNNDKKKPIKEKRTWHDGNAKVTEAAMAALDKSAASNNTDDSNDDEMKKKMAEERALQEARLAYLPVNDVEQIEAQLVGQDMIVESSMPQLLAEEEKDTPSSSWTSSITGLFQQLTGNKILTAQDLDPAVQAMEQLLTRKNVATEIAIELGKAVKKELVGKRLNSMYFVRTAVSQALEKHVTTILSRNHVDLLREVIRQKGSTATSRVLSSLTTTTTKSRPYVICVVGINGVGKSTTLAKLAYYFQSNNLSTLIVAGDTFRSGAVEQLRVHSQCLNVPLFSQGYSKDPSAVASAAIAHAMDPETNNGVGYDIVLIDTAGRMQNNAPLMKALGKLVAENQPDFVLLVCEALVGHDGLSQYRMFQQAIATGVGTPKSKSTSRRSQGVHGLILTKFDTVSHKVGAALTMTYQTGVPIVFCGTGQKYHHLKRINAAAVVASLMNSEK
jgi:signal recognition particle receptor subunit alpha